MSDDCQFEAVWVRDDAPHRDGSGFRASDQEFERNDTAQEVGRGVELVIFLGELVIFLFLRWMPLEEGHAKTVPGRLRTDD